MKVKEHYKLILSIMNDSANSYSPENFNSFDEAKKHWEINFRDRDKQDGHDEYWRQLPLKVQKITTIDLWKQDLWEQNEKLDRYTEPENYIDQSDKLSNIKWFILVAMLGIIMMGFLASCSKPTPTAVYYPYVEEQVNMKDTTGDTKKLEALIIVSKYWEK